ncbi:MAG: hypothetical protein PHV57_07025 [Methanomicrobiaceae archaeon]|nr:hypothetical protein [Methanomicrobiaceae archaeon]
MKPTVWACILILGILIAAPAAAAECSKPTLRLLPTDLRTDTVTADQAAALNDACSITLRTANPGVSVISNQDIGNMLTFERQKVLLGNDEGSDVNFATIGSRANTEYAVSLQVSRVGSRYLLSSSLIDADLAIVVTRATAEAGSIDELPAAVPVLVRNMGDLAARILAHETAHPVPPRDPSLAVTVTPESVAPDSGRYSADITVVVKSCRGNAVEGITIESDGSETRGTVTAGKTDGSGIAHLTYTLDVSRGRTAGEDSFQVVVVGRGQRKAYAPVTIGIEGIMLDATVAKPRISPREATDITVSLYSVDTNGARSPLAGRTLLLEKAMLSSDARVIPMGETDSRGQPVTDANGQVHLKFIAGGEERMEKLRILHQDVGRGYLDAIEAFVVIEVKKDEYRVTIAWDERGTGTYHYTQTGAVDEQVESTYSFGFDSRTTWDKYSGQEATTASLRYAEQGTSDYTGLMATESEYRPTVFGTEFLRWTTQGQGALKSAPSINLVVDERLGTLFVALNPVPVPVTTTGSSDISCDITFAGISGTTHYEVADDWNRAISALGSRPAPITFGDLSRYPLTDYFRDPNVTGLLEKTGSETYARRWHYEDRVDYSWRPFGDFFDITVEVNGEFARDATIRAVKL